MEKHLLVLLNSSINQTEIRFDNLDNAQSFLYSLNEALTSAKIIQGIYGKLRDSWRISMGLNCVIAKRRKQANMNIRSYTIVTLPDDEDAEFSIMDLILANEAKLEIHISPSREPSESIINFLTNKQYKYTITEEHLCLIPL